MQLFVKSSDLHTLNVVGSETVANVKQQVAKLEGLSAPDIAMYCHGRPLEDDEIISMYAEDQSTLSVEVRMLGGIAQFGLDASFIRIEHRVRYYSLCSVYLVSHSLI